MMVSSPWSCDAFAPMWSVGEEGQSGQYETPFGSIPAQSFAQSLCPKFWAAANQITTWGQYYASEHISWAKTLRKILKPCSKSLPKNFAQSHCAKSLGKAMQIMVKHIDEKNDRKR